MDKVSSLLLSGLDLETKARPDLSPEYQGLFMTHEYCRSVYLVMLMELPADWIVEFWSKHPIEWMEGRLGLADVLRYLWKRSQRAPLYWNCRVAGSVEPFFVSKGVFNANFTRKMMYRVNSSTYVPGKRILAWFYPLMGAAYNVFDARDMVFKLCTVFSENIWPGHLHRRVKRIELDGWIHSFLAYIPDRSYANRIETNFDYLAGEQIKASPKIFGLPPFEHIDYLADIRPPQRVLWQGELQTVGDVVLLDGARFGRKIGFAAFLESHGLDLEEFDPPDSETVLVENDYYCPFRKRIVIYGGCVYGAPMYLTRVRHLKRPTMGKNYLASLIADADIDNDPLESELEKKHLEILRGLETRSVFAYNAKDESISLDGRHFVKNVPAKILGKILSEYSKTGRQEFEYRESKMDSGISAPIRIVEKISPPGTSN